MQVIISPIFSGLGRVIKILLDKMCRRCYSKDGGVNAQNRRFAQGETMGNHSVYIITNLVNGKYYIGKTSKPSLLKYLQDAISSALRGERGRVLLHRAIRKYGASAFILELLTVCETNEQACDLERLWIIALDSQNVEIGYNVACGGEGPLGVHHTLETRKKWSEHRLKFPSRGMLGRKHSEATKAQMSADCSGNKNSFFGKTHSVKTRKAVAESNKRRVWDVASRQNMSEIVKHRITEKDKQEMSARASKRVRGKGGRFA